MPQTLRTLHVRRLKTHRLQPSRPPRDARAAAAFVRERRVVLSTARSSLPMLAEAIAGEPIRGSWMAHPAVYRIYDILRGLRKYDLVTAPLVLAKETLLAPSLGPAVERMAVDVRIVRLPETYLHLDQAVGVLSPDKLMVCRSIFDEELFRGYRTVPMPCQGHNVNFICLAPDEIIVPVSNLPLIDAAEKNRVLTHILDLSEFAKGTGGPNCLIMPVERR